MRAWKASYDAKLRATRDAPTEVPPSPAAAAAPAGVSTLEGQGKVVRELEVAKREKEGGVDAPGA